MRARRIKRLPVAKSGKLLGIVSLSDLAALASEEAKKLGSALDFFTDVVQAQSAQHNLPRETPGHEAASPVASFAATNNRNEMSDAGGPG
jgi:CBS domain-containing protein